MKRTTLAYAIATSLVSLVVIAGTSSPNSPIEEVVRVPIHAIDHDGMKSKRDDITVVIREIGDNDDSVGTRDKAGGIDTNFVAAPNPNDKPSTNLPPIDCAHPSYTSLCNDLKANLGNKEPEGPPKNVWTQLYAGSTTRSVSYKLAAKPKRIRFDGSSSGFSWSGGHINKKISKSAGNTDRRCKEGKVVIAQCTWSFNSTGAKGCYQRLKGTDFSKNQTSNGYHCFYRDAIAIVDMKFNRIEVMY